MTLPFRFIFWMPISAIQSTLLAFGKIDRCLGQLVFQSWLLYSFVCLLYPSIFQGHVWNHREQHFHLFNLLLLCGVLPHVCILNPKPYPAPKGMTVGAPSPLLQKVNPGCRFHEKFYRNRFRSVSNESSRREMSALSSYVVDLPPSVLSSFFRLQR